MITSPSIKKLVTTFDLEPAQARLIKELCAHRDNVSLLRGIISAKCTATADYASKCHGNPYDSNMWRTTLVLHAIDVVLGTHGVEPIGDDHMHGRAPEYEYCNAGDTYATTLIYKRESDRLFIGCWGDIAERMDTGE